ncbi:precorrin-6y C5,15-methyltransferase (decarboxylating) subunit CbiE [Alphaproteobacteria bacterium LSUCC0684]
MIWIDIIGLGERGVMALDRECLDRLRQAGLVIGAERMICELAGLDGFKGKAMPWPQPFLEIIPLMEKHRGTPVVVLATGDPLWYGAASTLVRYFSTDEMRITPAPSGFQLAASRMGWPLHQVATLTVHGRPHESVRRYLAPGARVLVLAHDRTSPERIGALLTEAGYGSARITALAHIGGAEESREEAAADRWADGGITVPDFHVIAIECPRQVDGFTPLVPGLPDTAFDSDGKLTKAEVRAATLAQLRPFRGGLLWDLGCGSGSIGIEWMRAAPEARAIGIDLRDDRLAVAQKNAEKLGVPEWKGVSCKLPSGLEGLPQPDAVFIGGGLSHELIARVLERLPEGGRLVANAVTLESEMVLLAASQELGGQMSRIAISRMEQVGRLHGWRPLMPVTQWALSKGEIKP